MILPEIARRSVSLALAAMVLTCLLGLTGCLQVTEELTLTTANTGTLRLQVAIPERTYDEWLAKAESSPLPGWAPFFDPAGAHDWPPAKSGLAITRHRAWRAQGQYQVLLEAKVTDFKAALAAGVLGPMTLSTAADGTQVLSWQPPAKGVSADHLALWREPLRSARLTLAITVPGTLVASPGAEVKGREARWAFSGADNLDWLSQPSALTVRYRP